MKDNPFVIWGLPEIIMGRKEEQKIILAFLSNVANGQSWVLLLSGPTGMGKTLLLKWAQKEAERQKFVVVFVSLSGRPGREHIIAELKAKTAGLLKELEESERIKKDSMKNFVKTQATGFAGFAKAAKKAVDDRPMVLIINDIDKAKNAQKIVEELSEVAENHNGIGVIVSSSKKLVPLLGNMMVTLKPVEEQDFVEYINKTTKNTAKIGDECARVVYADSGGNPKLLQFILWHLYEHKREADKIITQAHYNASRRAILSDLANEWFGELYADASEEERKILKELARVDEMSVTELAKALGKKEGPTATLVLRLLDRGDVVKVRRGTYKLFAPLYASFISER